MGEMIKRPYELKDPNVFSFKGTFPSFANVVLKFQCKVSGEVELLLKLCNYVPSILHFYPNFHSRYKAMSVIEMAISPIRALAKIYLTIVTTPNLIDLIITNLT